RDRNVTGVQTCALPIYPARLKAAFLADDFWIDRQDAHFAGHDHAVVGRQIEAAGPQAVAIEDRADIAAVAKHDRGRSVPRLHLEIGRASSRGRRETALA